MTWTQEEISDLVGNRRYCFVVMPYGDRGAFYEKLQGTLRDECGLECIRADEVPLFGEAVMGKLHRLIDNCEFVVADLTKTNANVYYEVGYAHARGKQVLAVSEKGSCLEADLDGLARIEYEDTRNGMKLFKDELVRSVRAVLGSERAMLRQMLIGPRALPSCLLASPRWHTARTASDKTMERRTYGDYLGVVGIVSAFGTLLGQEGVPDLISAQHPHPEVLKRDCNLYLIGSSRANHLTDQVLSAMQKNHENPWQIQASPDKDRSILVGLTSSGEKFEYEADHRKDVPDFDYGFIIRGPHPWRPGRIAMVLAGTRSLGTGAACLAATRLGLIEDIRDKLAPVPLDEYGKVIWVLVRATPDPDDNHTSAKLVRVKDAGVLG